MNDYIRDKWAHTGFQKYFRNTGWMFIGQVSSIISLGVNVWLARYLGPENYGTLNYVFAFVGLFAFFANLGINGILIRDLVKYPEKKEELMSTAFWLLEISGIIGIIVVSISAFASESTLVVRSLIMLYSTIFLFSPTTVIPAYFQAIVQAKKIAQVQIWGTVFVSIIKVILILSGKGIIWLIFTFVLDYVVGTVLYIYVYRRSGLKITIWKFNGKLAKQFLRAAVFLTLSGAAGYILLRIDQVMVNFYLGATAVGIYAVAVKLSEIWYFISGIITNSLFPAIINAKQVGEELYLKRLKKLYLFLGGTALLIAIPTAVLAPWIIRILFGLQYISSVPILQIYIWSGIGMFIGTGLSQYFLAENHLKSNLYYNLFGVVLNIGLNLILIPKIGLDGAALATLISYSLGPLLVVIFIFGMNRSTWLKNIYAK